LVALLVVLAKTIVGEGDFGNVVGLGWIDYFGFVQVIESFVSKRWHQINIHEE
jgi:hypothetical protein